MKIIITLIFLPALLLAGCISGSDSESTDNNGRSENPDVDLPIWYFDGDSDGYGDPAGVMEAEEQPAQYVSNADDMCPGEGDQGYGVDTSGCPIESVAISFMIDASGSIGGHEFETLKEAILSDLSTFLPTDGHVYVAVNTFSTVIPIVSNDVSDGTQEYALANLNSLTKDDFLTLFSACSVVQKSDKWVTDCSSNENALGYKGGYTNTGAALQYGIDLFDEQPQDHKVIVLLTDGVPCVSGECPADICQYKQPLIDAGVTTRIIGIGRGWTDDYPANSGMTGETRVACLADDGMGARSISVDIFGDVAGSIPGLLSDVLPTEEN